MLRQRMAPRAKGSKGFSKALQVSSGLLHRVAEQCSKRLLQSLDTDASCASNSRVVESTDGPALCYMMSHYRARNLGTLAVLRED